MHLCVGDEFINNISQRNISTPNALLHIHTYECTNTNKHTHQRTIQQHTQTHTNTQIHQTTPHQLTVTARCGLTLPSTWPSTRAADAPCSRSWHSACCPPACCPRGAARQRSPRAPAAAARTTRSSALRTQPSIPAQTDGRWRGR